MSSSAKITERSPDEAQNDYVRSGKGRKDDVGKSGIYPASSPDAPGDAEIRLEGELASHANPVPVVPTPERQDTDAANRSTGAPASDTTR